MRTADALALHRRVIDELRTSGAISAGNHTIVPLARTGSETTVADAPSRTLVSDAHGKPVGVLFVSNYVNPGLVGRSATRAQEAKRVLGASLGSVVLTPLAHGAVEGLSYALWPWHRVLSNLPIFRYVQRRRLRPAVLRWLRQVARDTRTPVRTDELGNTYQRPLQTIAERDGFIPPMRDAAEKALSRLSDGLWRPWYVLQHNDFWMGNLLLPRDRRTAAPHPWGFIVIDRAGARIRGFPFVDLLRFASSSGLSLLSLGKEIRWHSEALCCDTNDTASYILAALGHLSLNLEHVPEDCFQSWRSLCSTSCPAPCVWAAEPLASRSCPAPKSCLYSYPTQRLLYGALPLRSLPSARIADSHKNISITIRKVIRKTVWKIVQKSGQINPPAIVEDASFRRS